MIFEVDNLTYATPTGRVLQEGLGFRLGNRQLLLITGSNGRGKSTLLKTLLGQLPVVHGTVKSSVAADRIGYIPQLENTEIHLPVTLRDVLSMSSGEKNDEAYLRFGLLEPWHLDMAWNTASGGERKRALLTRALLSDPTTLVFDEPMNHLDAGSRRAMVAAMAEFLGNGETRSILMVSHQGLQENEIPLFDIVHLDLDGGRA